ncbi:flagellar motor protein MotB [Methylovorus sp. MM2]|uniref:OmpA family protein n=1 Tax=Methylovorus sp. MM2 TaxID=1848038 RepID=UPI0007E00E01|nr:OmpA family protein [Methylovorus sp. MM2]OAM53089.1 flagellar motor protein MotB [Methylovorus sp. MM2]
MNKNLISLAVAGALSVAAFSASAEEAYEGSWYGLAGISALHPDSDLDADSSGVGGFVRAGKELSEHWDVQIGGGYAKSSEDTGIAGVGGKYKQTLLGVDALYMFSREKFRPFLLAGLGVAHNKVDYSNAGLTDDSKTSWMANVGIGAQYLITETFGLQADLRQVWSKADYKPAESNETIGNTYLNIGAIWRFGAPTKVAAATPVATEPAVVPAAAEPVGPAAPAFEKVTLASEVLFGFDKDVLKEEGKKKLDVDVVEKMKAHPEVELVLITGHTDFIGDAGYNQKLSERRASAVKKYLVSQGIAESRLHAVGKGESEAVVSPEGVRGKKLIEALQPNRRVVVEIEVQRAAE